MTPISFLIIAIFAGLAALAVRIMNDLEGSIEKLRLRPKTQPEQKHAFYNAFTDRRRVIRPSGQDQSERLRVIG